MRKIQGNALAFHFSPEQPMTRQKPRAWNGKGGKQTGFFLPEGKPGADPVVDGSVIILYLFLSPHEYCFPVCV